MAASRRALDIRRDDDIFLANAMNAKKPGLDE
jgi:hypothetical protein